jgi:hypothetical protein
LEQLETLREVALQEQQTAVKVQLLALTVQVHFMVKVQEKVKTAH